MTQASEEADALQRKYRSGRKRWARGVGRPYPGDAADPAPPGQLETDPLYNQGRDL